MLSIIYVQGGEGREDTMNICMDIFYRFIKSPNNKKEIFLGMSIRYLDYIFVLICVY